MTTKKNNDGVNEKVNISFESHLKISDITQADRPKTIISSRILNDRSRLNNTQESK